MATHLFYTHNSKLHYQQNSIHTDKQLHGATLFTRQRGTTRACLSPTLNNLYTHDLPPPFPTTEYIAFADDITQITAGTYNYRYAAHNTKHAIEQINTFENKWMFTNKSKFTMVPLTRLNTSDILIGDDHYPYTTKGKILGLNFTYSGIQNKVSIRKAIANTNLTKLNRFKHLNTRNKLKLYTTLIRPTLICSPNPQFPAPIYFHYNEHKTKLLDSSQTQVNQTTSHQVHYTNN